MITEQQTIVSEKDGMEISFNVLTGKIDFKNNGLFINSFKFDDSDHIVEYRNMLTEIIDYICKKEEV